IGLIRLEPQIFSTVADHHAYLAMLGVALAVGFAAGRRHIFAVVATYVIIACAAWSFRQTWHWKSTDALVDHELASVDPHSLEAFTTLARDRLDNNDPAKAVQYAN